MGCLRIKPLLCGPCIGSGERVYMFENDRKETTVCDICGGSGLKRERPPMDLRDLLLEETGALDS